MGDVNINVPTATAKRTVDNPEEVIKEVPRPVIDLSNEPVKISACTKCGGYPKVVFVEGGNCVKGKCFDKFVKELLAGEEE